MKVYIAAPFARWSRAKRTRKMLRATGFTVDSAWIDDAERIGGTESGQNRGVMRDALLRNDADMLTSDAVIAMTYHDEGGEMFAEARLALHHGIRVLWVGERETGSMSREGSVVCDTMADVYAWLVAARGDGVALGGGA